MVFPYKWCLFHFRLSLHISTYNGTIVPLCVYISWIIIKDLPIFTSHSNQHKHLHSISCECNLSSIPDAARWLLAGSSSNKYNSTRIGWCPQQLNQLGFPGKKQFQANSPSCFPFLGGVITFSCQIIPFTTEMSNSGCRIEVFLKRLLANSKKLLGGRNAWRVSSRQTIGIMMRSWPEDVSVEMTLHKSRVRDFQSFTKTTKPSVARFGSTPFTYLIYGVGWGGSTLPRCPSKKKKSFEPTAWPCYEEINRKINKSHLWPKTNIRSRKYRFENITQKYLISWRFKRTEPFGIGWVPFHRHYCPVQPWSKWCQTHGTHWVPPNLNSTDGVFVFPRFKLTPTSGKLHVNSQYINASKIWKMVLVFSYFVQRLS